MNIQKRRYSAISTINHWITALLVIAMLTLGLVGGHAPAREIARFVLGVHVSLGFFAFIFIIWRIAFRLYEGFAPPAGVAPLDRHVAPLVHRLLLLVLALQVITGPLYLFTEGEAVDVFGWFSVYLPLSAAEVLHEPSEVVHVILGVYVLPTLLILHLLGAIRHYWRREQETPADM